MCSGCQVIVCGIVMRCRPRMCLAAAAAAAATTVQCFVAAAISARGRENAIAAAAAAATGEGRRGVGLDRGGGIYAVVAGSSQGATFGAMRFGLPKTKAIRGFVR